MSFPVASFKCSHFSNCDGNHDIEVTVVKVDEKPTNRHLFTAKIGDSSYEHSITVGAKEGPLVDYPQEQFQKDVDDARLFAAKQVHFHHTIKEMEGHIK